MELPFDGSVIRAGSEARERFYDSRGYGRPVDGGLELTPVEAAHLLFRGDLDAVRDDRHGQMGVHEFLASTAVSEVAFFVYKELRDRGFYLSPVGDADETAHRAFEVFPRGQGPWDETVAYRVRAVSEREDVTAETLQALASGETTGVLAVVDEESEVTYLEVDEPTLHGSSYRDLSPTEGSLLSDRVLVTEPPEGLYERAFYGQRLDREERAVQLSLVEAAYLTDCDRLRIDAEAGHEAVLERGREVEGERFDRRLRAYSALREAGIVPKTGFKFGSDFRTYADVTSVDDLGHSELLVRVLPADHTFTPRDLALDVRLAHGVRKRMVVALPTTERVEWLSVERLTP